MNANTIRLTEQRDEAQSQVRSLETDVRILRSQLAEAVALLRRVYFDWDGEKHVRANDDLVSTYAIDECVAGDAHAFLARIDGAKDVKAVR